MIAGDTFVMDMFDLQLGGAISAFQSYWHSEDAQKIVKNLQFMEWFGSKAEFAEPCD